MSIDVTWPIEKSEYDKAAIDCLHNHLSNGGIDLFLKMANYDKQKIFEFIKAAGYHVNPKLLNK